MEAIIGLLNIVGRVIYCEHLRAIDCVEFVFHVVPDNISTRPSDFALVVGELAYIVNVKIYIRDTAGCSHCVGSS